ncbi:MAG: hypothetical protein EZS28_035415 [Streblomastix strix]|uniref:Uncharacterized protein n=1 Tax=Streblomastix strix TaxID=222440 RepID=A0A5J4UEK2_9EUKA|nr:MAG: hypothetical protein EZS28_035415 [Streblomastix strix]
MTTKEYFNIIKPYKNPFNRGKLNNIIEALFQNRGEKVDFNQPLPLWHPLLQRNKKGIQIAKDNRVPIVYYNGYNEQDHDQDVDEYNQQMESDNDRREEIRRIRREGGSKREIIEVESEVISEQELSYGSKFGYKNKYKREMKLRGRRRK